ncbi:patatin-like phospholipase family protein [Saccharicrinis sp. FJH2]|uniref:patatin-like phospholipase family protein n=1 Tax=Saccharicrinis sp. FJH65 TaxID=3344659 RepID=UPI0035F4E602
MEISDFTENPEVFMTLRNLKQDGIDKKIYSDVVDSEKNQYVELVQEGGGVLGVALIGYTYVMEQMGIRFFSLAGTSAGSINALLLASLGNINESKYEKLLNVLASKNLYDFVDGDKDSKDFIEAVVEKAKRVKLIWKGMQVIDNVFDSLGLNPGNDFYRWLADVLMKNGIVTTKDLLDQFISLPDGLKIRDGVDRTLEGLKPKFAVIASDITTETKVEFPAMRSLYWANADEINPAYYVRASMSIPYFFEPLVIDNLPQGPDAMNRWYDMAKFKGVVPEKAYFVDGGIMSNFPIDLFHKFNTVPRLPTFGVKLGVDRNKANTVESPLGLFGALFNSIRHLHDYEFILKNPELRMLVQNIDIGEHDWLNFGITEEAKIDLFVRGARAADQFLRNFNWEKYKQVRAGKIIK